MQRLLPLTTAVLMAVILSACASFNPRTFDPLARASNDIVTALTERPSLPRFSPLRQSFATALNDVKPHVKSSKEKTLFGEYEVVDERLGEMLTVWEGLEKEVEMLPVTQPLGAALKTRYELGVNTNDPPSIYVNEALLALRDDIKARIDKTKESLAATPK